MKMKKILKRNKIFAIVIILLFGGIAFLSSKQINLQPKIIVGPYTQNVTNNSITILWETDIPTNNNSVEYGENTSYGYIKYGNANACHHEIIINPSFSSGYYRVISDGIKSNEFKFNLASHCYTTKKFKCIIFGDSRGVWDNWRNATKVAKAVNDEHPDIVIHGGDMVKDGKSRQQWNEWLNLMKPLMQNSTLFGVLGNHEENGSRYYEIFALPNNEMWYSFDYGPCHFTILDEYEPWNVGSMQYKWLENDLSSNNAPFKIVCFHEPIYCSGGHSPRKDIRKVWEPLFEKYNVSIVFQSHNHYYQRINPINGITYIISGGAGAPLYNPKSAYFINISKKAYHYCVLNVSLKDMEIIFSAKYINGSTFDRFVIHASPNIKIIKPRNGLYITNHKIISLSNTIIVGRIDIEAEASDSIHGINRVEFYVDGKYKGNDTIAPYSWLWNEKAIGRREIKATAYNNVGKTNSDKINVVIFNL